jgi:quercetin dioxygenase-like cupin family protein
MICANAPGRAGHKTQEPPLKPIIQFGLPALAIMAGAAIALAPHSFAQGAQNQPASGGPGSPDVVTVNDPAGAPPDPKNIPFVLPKDIKWKVDTAFGEDEAPLFGDVTKPGLYGMLIRWKPGQFSTPHFHSTDRYIYVVSGTWWVSSSDHYDPKTTYPLPAGSFATDMKEKIHWDGAKDETVILELVGEGPATTEKVVGK